LTLEDEIDIRAATRWFAAGARRVRRPLAATLVWMKEEADTGPLLLAASSARAPWRRR
jgi:hypothetical protein